MDASYVAFHQRTTIERHLIAEGHSRAEAAAHAKSLLDTFAMPCMTSALQHGGTHFQPPPSVISALESVARHASPLVQARRDLVRHAADAPLPVAAQLVETFQSWLHGTMTARGAEVAVMRGDLHALRSFCCLHTLALPYAPSFLERIRAWSDAAELFAALGAAGLLVTTSSESRDEDRATMPSAAAATASSAATLVAWLDECLRAFERNRLGEEAHGALGRAIAGKTRRTLKPGDGRDVDDRAAARRRDERNAMLHAEKDAIDIDRLLAAPVLIAHFEDRSADTDTGIVDQHMKPAETVLGMFHHRFPLGLVHHVMADERGSAALIGDGVGHCLRACSTCILRVATGARHSACVFGYWQRQFLKSHSMPPKMRKVGPPYHPCGLIRLSCKAIS